MSGELLSSKVVVVEEEPRVRGIPSAPTSVAAAIGIAERGPLDVAVLCTSFEEYQAHFGGFTADADLPLAAMGFFENGGSQLCCVRTVHHTSVDDPATATAVRAVGFLTSPGTATPARVTGTVAGPFLLADGAKLVVSVGGAPDQEVVFKGLPALTFATAAPTYALAEGQTFDVRIDGGLPQQLVILGTDMAVQGAATPLEVVTLLNARLNGCKTLLVGGVPRLVSDTAGTASRIEVLGGTANTVLGFPTTPVSGVGNVPNIRAVTVADVQSLAPPALAGVVASAAPGGFVDLRTTATGATAQLQVKAGTAAGFGLDTGVHTGAASGAANALRVEGKDPGAYGNHLALEVRAPSSGEAGAFDLAVIEDGTYREVFPNLRMAPAASRHVERIVNDPRTGSRLVRVIDQLLPGTPALGVQSVTLAGGGDGLTGLTDNDFIGSATGRTGLHALDRIQDVSVLLVPGRATPAVQNAMLQYCEVERDGAMFAVLDPPAGMSAVQIVTYVATTAALLGLSEFGAIYWPRVRVLNPDRAVFGSADTIVVPPSGILAGIYARTDAARPGGVYDPPAGIDVGRMFGVLGFETDEVLEERKRDLVYPKRINPLTTGPGLPRYVDGSRTLKGDGNFPYVAERRGVSSIERALKQGLQFARHKNNTEGLRAAVRRTVTTFLLTQMNNGAFRSREPSKAFFVDMSQNSPSSIFSGKLFVRVGLATNKPAEFIVLSLSQDTRTIEAELAAGGG